MSILKRFSKRERLRIDPMSQHYTFRNMLYYAALQSIVLDYGKTDH